MYDVVYMAHFYYMVPWLDCMKWLIAILHCTLGRLHEMIYDYTEVLLTAEMRL